MRVSRWLASPVLAAFAVACGGSYGPTPTSVEPQDGVDVRVTVDGEAWRPVRSLEASGPDDPHYVLSMDDDGSASIVFGDGIRGRRPPRGATIGVSYRTGDRPGGGRQGNVQVSVRRVAGARTQLPVCLVIRANDRRLDFRPCDADRGR